LTILLYFSYNLYLPHYLRINNQNPIKAASYSKTLLEEAFFLGLSRLISTYLFLSVYLPLQSFFFPSRYIRFHCRYVTKSIYHSQKKRHFNKFLVYSYHQLRVYPGFPVLHIVIQRYTVILLNREKTREIHILHIFFLLPKLKTTKE